MTQEARLIGGNPNACDEPPSIFGQFIVFFFCWVGLVLLIAPELKTPAVRIIYNASDSAPRGLYLIEPASRVRAGDLVVVRLRRDVGALAAQRGYLPAGVPVIKRVAAIAPQRVCADTTGVHVDGESVAQALDADAAGRPLPAWHGCRALVDTELFLLSAHPASFDSRYFGPVDGIQVVGRARPLWKRRGE
jgi:conjugative transfer signal peptidase TraF